MDKFKKGDVVYHKATMKRCVVANTESDGRLYVTDQDGQRATYEPDEFWTEDEWKQRNANLMTQASATNSDPYE